MLIQVILLTSLSTTGICPTEWILALTNVAQTPVIPFHWKHTWCHCPLVSCMLSEATRRFLIVTLIVSLGWTCIRHNSNDSFLFPESRKINVGIDSKYTLESWRYWPHSESHLKYRNKSYRSISGVGKLNLIGFGFRLLKGIVGVYVWFTCKSEYGLRMCKIQHFYPRADRKFRKVEW